MNVRLLRKVAKHISDEPRRYEQNATLRALEPEELDDLGGDAPPCGTKGCIAGWICVITGKTPRQRRTFSWSRAKRELELTTQQANRLFAFTWDSKGWPLKFAQAYGDASTPAERAKAAVARIEHFIKTKGEE